MADILIVEDDAELAATLGDLLSFEGHTTRVAFDGAEGLHAMDEHLPDLILLDIEMPVLNGVEMAHEVMVKNAGRERIPVIVSSACGDLESVADSLGTPYRLAKPSSLDALSKLVDIALVEHQAPHPPPARRDAR